jgi:hypothetical protein
MVNVSAEAQAVLDRIEDNCQLLWDGYYEHIEYSVEVCYHRGDCKHRGTTAPKGDCENCPVVNEKRSAQKKRPGLLQQLQEFKEHKDTDRELKAERGAPRIKVAGRPPGDMGGFFLLDEITCEATALVDRVLEEVGRDRTWATQSILSLLRGLPLQVSYFVESRPDQARLIDKACQKWVDSARSTLKISTRDTIFDSVVCGNCGGALSTPAGNRGDSDVRCIGTPTAPPCGETYPPGEWLALYERSRAES